jgi:hypothetical protein
MLAFLAALCRALLAHDALEVRRLLKAPQARQLPRRIREEALAISRGGGQSLRAPVQTLAFYHQTQQLLLEEPDPTDGPQLELALRPTPVTADIELTVARARRVAGGRRRGTG